MSGLNDGDENRYTEQFGDYLKRHREASSLSLDAIAKTTRISKRFLEAFENSDLPHFPDDAFARGFLKVYARELGLEADEVMARYDQLKRAHAPTQIRTLSKVKEMPQVGFESFAKSQWLWGLITIILGLVVIVGLGQWVLKERPADSSSAPKGNEILLSSESSEKAEPSVSPTMIEPPLIQTAEPKATAEEPAVPVQASLLAVTAIKAATFSYRVDENRPETLTLKPGESRIIHVQRDIEVTLNDRSALQMTYNGKPMVIQSTTLKLFNRNLFMKR